MTMKTAEKINVIALRKARVIRTEFSMTVRKRVKIDGKKIGEKVVRIIVGYVMARCVGDGNKGYLDLKKKKANFVDEVMGNEDRQKWNRSGDAILGQFPRRRSIELNELFIILNNVFGLDGGGSEASILGSLLVLEDSEILGKQRKKGSKAIQAIGTTDEPDEPTAPLVPPTSVPPVSKPAAAGVVVPDPSKVIHPEPQSSRGKKVKYGEVGPGIVGSREALIFGLKRHEEIEVIRKEWVYPDRRSKDGLLFMALTGKYAGSISDQPSALWSLLGGEKHTEESDKKQRLVPDFMDFVGQTLVRKRGGYGKSRHLRDGKGVESKKAIEILMSGKASVVEIVDGYVPLKGLGVPAKRKTSLSQEEIRNSKKFLDFISELRSRYQPQLQLEPAEPTVEPIAEAVEPSLHTHTASDFVPVGPSDLELAKKLKRSREDAELHGYVDKCKKCVEDLGELSTELNRLDDEIESLREKRSHVVRDLDDVEAKRREYQAIIMESTGG